MQTSDEIKKEKFSEFIEAAAHDLHSPLRKLSVLVDRVFTRHVDRFDDDAKEYIRRIENCVSEMQSLIDGLAELARADTKELINSPVDLSMIVKRETEAMQEELEKRNAEIYTDPLPVIKGNEIQYRQLFKNLLENALKFSKNDGSVRIEIKATHLTTTEKDNYHFSQEKMFYRIEICDNGIGFDQAYAEKIFEPFVRLHPRSKYHGNGLGLSICKKIVTNHNGTIYAQGNEQTGSRFTLILPETP
jgi:signal transduction histidine kinase